ncbi:hypothetical protein AB2M62_04690 [Sphingomonas sp. MMS12-HWE2-04]|uniref:hypothetical protein n=1 Tax=Sphingomonas sp. MMS12-HWE2-04 TaxID=3234199 RepID=UPI00384CC59C
MALAILVPEDDGPAGKRWFRFDVGTSPFCRFAVGGPERRQLDGVSLLGQPVWTSPMLGPLPAHDMGRGRYGIDESVFQGEAEFVQMMSYRTAQREGPAVSAIVRSRSPLPAMPPAPALFARAASVSRPERAQPVANALGLLDILGALAPMVGQLLGGLRGGGTPAPGPAPAPGGADLLQRLADPATIKLLTDLIAQVSHAPAPAPPPGLSSTKSVRYSEAQIAPALLAALPALMPLLQQVLSPQTIQTLVDAPNRAAQTVINGVTDVMKLGIQNNQAEMDHLKDLNPGVDDPAFDRLMEGLGLGPAAQRNGRDWLRTTRVRLAFDGLRSVSAGGANRVVFASDRAIVLPMRVELPELASGGAPRLGEASLSLEVKDPVSLAVVRRARARVDDIVASGAAGSITLPLDQVAQLGAGRDWLLSVTLTWRGPKKMQGRRLGVVMTQLIHLAGGYVFDALHEEGPAIDLADPDQHRPFWHKVWAGRFAEEARRFEAEVDYHYGWDAGARDVVREESSIQTRPADGSVAGMQARVKSGLVLSPDALAAVAATLDPDSAPLDPGVRAALNDPLLAERLGLGARAMLKLRGRQDEAFALWAYPAVRRAKLALLKPRTVLETGNITEFAPHQVPFAVPTAINLVGTRAR